MKIIRHLDASGQPRFASLDAAGAAHELAGDLLTGLTPTGRPVTPGQLLAPLAPTQIIGIGLNYRRHAEETKAKIPDYPIVFAKTLNTLQHPGQPIELPRHLASSEVDYECELAVVIGRTCKNVARADALRYVLGYTCANDVSARDWQIKRGGSQWTRGKCFDTFCPLGPALVTADEIPDPNTLTIRTVLNDQVVQNWNTNDMIFDVPALIEFLSGSTTLLAGTVILTGTPHGVGMAATPQRWLRPGDTVTVEIEKIGSLTNPVRIEP